MDNREQACEAVELIASQMAFGDAGKQLVIEEKLVGQEVSILAITDGQTIVTMPPAQDHKPAGDGDTGPNTGGMGAYCPTGIISGNMMDTVLEKILIPTIHQMKRSGRPFSGVLYAGLMVTKKDVKVLEYNVRFGDPECQPLMMRLESDLVDVLEATIDGELHNIKSLRWDPRPAVCVVDGQRRLSGQLRPRPSHPRPRRSGQAARRKSISRRHFAQQRPSLHQRRPRTGRNGLGQQRTQRQVASLHRRKMHPLGRRLVP